MVEVTVSFIQQAGSVAEMEQAADRCMQCTQHELCMRFTAFKHPALVLWTRSAMSDKAHLTDASGWSVMRQRLSTVRNSKLDSFRVFSTEICAGHRRIAEFRNCGDSTEGTSGCDV